MKKKILCAILAVFTSVSLFAESIHGFNLITGYKSNSFEYDNLIFDSNIWRLSLGYSYQFYPNYNSVVGFMISPNVGFDIPFGTKIENNGSKSKVNSKYNTDMLYPVFFNTDLALNFRIPRGLEKGFPYIRLGTTWQTSFFQLKEDVEYFADSVSGSQQNLSAFIELGFQPRHYEDYSESGFDTFFTYYRSDISIRFIYDFLTKNPLTDDNWIGASNFGIMLIWKPWQRSTEHQKDKEAFANYKEKRKQEIISTRDKADVHSKQFKLVEKKDCKVEDIEYLAMSIINGDRHFDNSFLEIPVTAEFYRQTTADGNYWLEFSEPFLRDITFIKHTLGNGKVGTEEYITCSEEKITLPFYTEEEKEKAFKVLVEEYDVRQQQKARIAENRRLAEENQKKLFNAAVASKSLSKLTDYIKKNWDERHFQYSAFEEVAKLLAKDSGVKMKRLPYSITNPYNLDRNCIYIEDQLSVYQWTGRGTFLAQTSEGIMIYIRSVYDLSTIDKYADCVYLRYAGTFEYNSISAGVQVVPQFDLIYNIEDVFPYGK